VLLVSNSILLNRLVSWSFSAGSLAPGGDLRAISRIRRLYIYDIDPTVDTVTWSGLQSHILEGSSVEC
jgi:hypothetical protein